MRHILNNYLLFKIAIPSSARFGIQKGTFSRLLLGIGAEIRGVGESRTPSMVLNKFHVYPRERSISSAMNFALRFLSRRCSATSSLIRRTCSAPCRFEYCSRYSSRIRSTSLIYDIGESSFWLKRNSRTQDELQIMVLVAVGIGINLVDSFADPAGLGVERHRYVTEFRIPGSFEGKNQRFSYPVP